MAPFKGQGFKLKDEIYRTARPLYSRSKELVLMSLDTSDPTTRNVKEWKDGDEDTGISWVKEVGKGRVFYCSLGHNDPIFMNPVLLEHFLRGIQFAAGDFPVPTKPKGQAAKAASNASSSNRVKPGTAVGQGQDVRFRRQPGSADGTQRRDSQGLRQAR